MKSPDPQSQHSWQDALRHIRDLASHREISDSEWGVIAGWLLESEFDGTSFLAGEAAALLIRDRAPGHVKAQLDLATEDAEGWPLYWRLIILPEAHPNRFQMIEKCCMSPILLVQQRGVIAMRSQPVVTQ